MSFSVRLLVLFAFSGLAYGVSAVFSPVAAAQDVTPPRVESVSSSVYSNEDTQTIQLNFSEAVVNIDASDFTVVGSTATITEFSNPFDNTYRLVISGGDLADIADTDLSLGLAGGQDITDVAGNALTTIVSLGGWTHVNVNNTRPDPVFTSSAIAPVSQPFTVNLAFPPTPTEWTDSIINGTLTQSDIVVGNGTIESFTLTSTGEGYQTGANIVVRPSADGAVTLDLPENAVYDEASNQNTAATQFSIAADIDPPTVNIFKPGAACPCTGAITVTIVFSEDNITGFDINDLVTTGATLSNFSFNGRSGSVTMTPTGDGTMTLDVPAGSAVDADGFGNVAATQFSAVIDTTRPTVSFSTAAAAPVTGEFDLDITFSEAMTNIGNTGAWSVANGSRLSVTGSGANYVMRVRPQQGGQGTLTVDLAENGFSDAAGNGVVAPAQFSIAFDRANPRIASVERFSPAQATTNADSLTFTVTFSEDVSNVDAADFDIYTIDYSPANTTATITDVTAVSASVYRVTVSGGNLDSLNNTTITLNGRTDGNILDAANNVMTVRSPQTAPEAYTMDNAAPRIASIERFSPTAGRASNDTVRWRVTFSEAVNNVTADDFTVTGTTGALSISNLTTTTADLDLSGGDMAALDGSVVLAVSDSQNIADTGGNPMTNTTPTGANENSFIMDNTAPRVSSVVRQSPAQSPTNADSVTWRVTFNEDVTGVGTNNIGLAVPLGVQADTITTSVTQVTASTYDVTASGGDLVGMNGEITLRIFTTVQDVAFNVLADATPTGADERTYLIDNTGPGAFGIYRATPSDERTNADSLVWAINFPRGSANDAPLDPATIDGADFVLTGPAGTILTTSVQTPADDDGLIMVTASGGDLAGFTGTASLAFAPGHNISDVAGNLATVNSLEANESFDVRNTAPLLASISRQTPPDSRTNADSLKWRFTFAQIDNDFALPANAFTVIGTTATVTSVSRFSIGFDVTISGGDLSSLDGDVTIGLANSDHLDDYGNVMDRTIPAGAEQTYTVDNTEPGLIITGRGDPIGGAFVGTFTFTEDVSGFTMSDIAVNNGSLAGFAQDTASRYTVTVTPAASGPLTLDVPAGAVNDLAGNPSVAAPQLSIMVDMVAPGVSAINRHLPTSGTTNDDTLTWQVIFNEPVEKVSLPDFVLGGTSATITRLSTQPPAAGLAGPRVAEASGPGVPEFSGTTFYITASGGDLASLDGTVSLGLADGHNIGDAAGNRLADFNPLATDERIFTVDNSAPTLQGFSRNTPATEQTDADSLVFAITFNEAVSNVSADDFTITGTTATGVLAGSGTSYTLTLSGGDLANINAIVGLDLAASQNIADAAGNALPAGEPDIDQTFNILNDTVSPRLVSISRAQPTLLSPTQSDTLNWQVVFDEDVTGVDASDFAITGTTATITNVAAQDARTYTITIGGGDLANLDGFVYLNLAATPSIDDVAGNTLTQTSPTGANTNYFRLDHAGPTPEFLSSATSPVAGAFALDINFSEYIVASSFTLSDLVVSNGTASNLVVRPSADVAANRAIESADSVALETSFTVTITPTSEGSVTIDLPAGAVNDFVGNASVGATQFSMTYDNTAPRLASISRAQPTLLSPTQSDTLNWHVVFDEGVTSVDAADFSLTGTSATVTNVSPVMQSVSVPPAVQAANPFAAMAVSNREYVVTIGGGDLTNLNGLVYLNLVATPTIDDLAGNRLIQTSPTGSNTNYFRLDHAGPIASFSTVATSPVAGAFALDIDFSEYITVSSFTLSDLVVGNGTASNLVVRPSADVAASEAIEGAANEALEAYFTVTITPSANGFVTVDLPAGAVSDFVGNTSDAATQFSVTNEENYTLTVNLPGVGAGTVSSTPTGITCGTDCSEDFPVGTAVTLTATAASGSSFAGWTEGPCTGSSDADCRVTLSQDQTVSARFTLDSPPAGRIVAATAPSARSGRVGGPVITAFLSVVSRTSSPAQTCQIAAPSDAPVTLSYRKVDAANSPIGAENPVFDIAAGATLSFVIAMTPTVPTGAGGYDFLPVITCQNASLDPIVGVNSVLLNIGVAPTPDILAVSATPSNDGVIRIPGPGRVGFMSASALNVGVGDGSAGANQATVTVTADTGAAALPVTLEVCEIDPVTAACITPRGASATGVWDQNQARFFAVFVRDTSTGGIAFDPANSRVFLRFADATGTIRSATSAAVTAPAPASAPEIASSLPVGRWSVLMRQPAGIWPGLARSVLYVMEDGRVVVDDGVLPRLVSLEAGTAANDNARHFVAEDAVGQWTPEGMIRLGGPWAEQAGEFWGVRDRRSDDVSDLSDVAGVYQRPTEESSDYVRIDDDGSLNGIVSGCILSGSARSTGGAPGGLAALMRCSDAGEYTIVVDMPANDGDAPVLLLANESQGWRLERSRAYP